MLRFLWRFVAFLAEMNGYTPFFQALFKAYLAIIVGGLSVLSGWVCSVFGTQMPYHKKATQEELLNLLPHKWKLKHPE